MLEMNSGSRLARAVLATAVFFLAGMPASGKSKVVMSWKNPSVTVQKFHRVLALGLSDKTEIRADFEDALAARLAETGVEAVPGNTILLRPEGTKFDLNYLREQVREQNIDAVVVTRLIKVDRKTTYIPGGAYYAPYPYYNTLYGYYGAVYPVIYTPDYLREEKKVRIETNLYIASAPDGQLVWTAVTDTFNPTDVHKAIRKLVQLIVKQMQTEGVL